MHKILDSALDKEEGTKFGIDPGGVCGLTLGGHAVQETRGQTALNKKELKSDPGGVRDQAEGLGGVHYPKIGTLHAPQ